MNPAPQLWTVKTVPHHKSRRWYALHWNGPTPLSYLKDGRTSGRYKCRHDAQRLADARNEYELLKSAVLERLGTEQDVGNAIRTTSHGPSGTLVTLSVFVPYRSSDTA